MGLIKSKENATDANRFSCAPMPTDMLMRKGLCNGSDILKSGAQIDIAEGQAALIVEDGKVIDFSAECGSFVWDITSEPSCFTGAANKNMLDAFKRSGGSFTYRASAEKTQSVYYVNMQKIVGNKFGTAAPVKYYDPFYKTVIYIRYYGKFDLRIADPISLFASISDYSEYKEYTQKTLWSLIGDAFLLALDAALAKCSKQGIKFSDIAGEQAELTRHTGEILSENTKGSYGLELLSVEIAKVTPDEKSRARIEKHKAKTAQTGENDAKAFFENAPTEALKKASSNKGSSISALMARGYGKDEETGKLNKTLAEALANPTKWKCPACGTENSGKFCSECGRKSILQSEWLCPRCGTPNNGKFCSECGRKR